MATRGESRREDLLLGGTYPGRGIVLHRLPNLRRSWVSTTWPNSPRSCRRNSEKGSASIASTHSLHFLCDPPCPRR